MLLAVGGMTQVIIELELTQYFGKRRTRKMIDKLQDHIIVCGFGRVGRGAARELQRAGVPFLIVDKSEDRVEWAMRDGMLGVLADATDDETLRHAGVHAGQRFDCDAAERRRQSVRDPFSQGAEAVAAGFCARRAPSKAKRRCGWPGPTTYSRLTI